MQACIDTCAQDCLPRTRSLRVILINLNRSTDRLARMQAEFERVGVGFERFSAVNGTDLPESVKPYFCDAAGKVVSPLRPGEIGCYASHLGVWQRIAAGRYGAAALVCEDDVGLPDDLIPLLARLLNAAPSGWDVIRLSSNTRRPVAAVAPLGAGRNLVQYWRGPPLSGAYLVSRAGASKLLQPKLRRLPVDEDLARPWLFDIDAYGVLPAPVTQKDVAPSNIEAMGGRERGTLLRTRLTRKSEHASRHAYNLRTMGFSGWLACFVASRALRLGLSTPISQRFFARPTGPSAQAPRYPAATSADYYEHIHETNNAYKTNNWLVSEIDAILSVGARSILEVGCGNGRFLAKVKGRVERVIGVDWAKSPVINELGLSAHFERCDITRDELPRADIVCSADVLEHIAPDLLVPTLRRLRNAGHEQYHVIACYDDNHSHLSIMEPEAWLKTFHSISNRYRLLDVRPRRGDPAQSICVVATFEPKTAR